ncbi:MAG: ISL3 family transposase [Marinagarivorans sp.]
MIKLNWHQINAIKERAVERRLARRAQAPIHHIGLDEKQFRSGHQYITSLFDLDEGRVLDVIEERTEEAAEQLITQTLTKTQRTQVNAVASDMWKAYANSVEKMLPNSKIVHDCFHIVQHLNKAVDQVRRSEHRTLLQQGNSALKGTKFQWLRKPENLSDDDVVEFSQVVNSHLKTAKAWSIKEIFRTFWAYRSKAAARKFFMRWHARAVRSRLKPMDEKAKMIKRHIENFINYFDFRITNAAAEGLNSKIQTVKADARGFRSFKNFRTSVLFYCGKLEMLS